MNPPAAPPAAFHLAATPSSAIAAADVKALRGPILVLGAGGFVGANLFLHLVAHRDDVYAVILHAPSWRLAGVKRERILEVDLTDPAAARNLVDSIRPETVFDTVAYGGYSFEADAELIHRTNYLAMVQLLELLMARPRPITAYIHAGSSSEYGRNCAAPKEDAHAEPNSHYAVSKLAAANHLFFLGKVKSFPCVNLRLYAVYGQLEDASRLIPNLVSCGIRHEYPPLVSPDISRDFIHIDDTCNAFVRAAVALRPDFYGESYNIGTGRRTTMRDLAATARTVFDIATEPQFGSMAPRAWDLTDWYGDPAKAIAAFGWSATIPLDEGLRRTAAWVRALPEGSFASLTKRNTVQRKRSLSAIIAVYRDEPAVPIMYERLTRVFTGLGIDYEIIFVNDASPDQAGEKIRELSAKDPRVLGITHSRNFGSQMAFRSGMELSTKQGVVLLDGDLQDPPELIADFYKQWEAGFDVIYGRRVKREMPVVWGLLYKAFYRVFAAFSYIPIPHDAGDFSLIDRRVVLWLITCPERDLFLRGLRAYVGFKQCGVDYLRPERQFGVSTNNLFRLIGWAKRGIFSFSDTPLTMLTTGGVLLIGLSMLFSVIAVGLRVFLPAWVPQGFTTIELLVMWLGAINLFAIGLVGEYIGRIMAEVKSRPRLIRSGLIRNGKVAELLPDGSVRS
jgi:dolichol-phosphate mannosyltransferase